MTANFKVVLFTAHAPTVGGGGTILRSLVPELEQNFDIRWAYLSSSAVPGREEDWLGPPLMGAGGVGRDALRTALLLGGSASHRVCEIEYRLRAMDPDVFWVVSHNEGLRVAWELLRGGQRPVHLTVHDDWAGALCARSTRYRLLAALADSLTRRVLKRVSSVDVVSHGMQDFYRRSAGIEAMICHRYLAHLPSPASPPDGPLTVGHIGSIYSAHELWCFADAFKRFCGERGEKGRIRLWGCHLSSNDVPGHLEDWIEFHPNETEDHVVLQLQQCHFVYAMYPFARRLRRFSQTSLPTKLSTYVLAQRPILGHGPAQSTLATFLRDTQTGVTWSGLDPQDGVRAIGCLMVQSGESHRWERARQLYFGYENIRVMLQALNKAAARAANSLA
jgi:hypothetical protein